MADASLESNKRQAIDYGRSEQEAIEKVRKDCADYADQISQALHAALQAEQHDCHMKPDCEKQSFDNYNERKKAIFEDWDALCNEKELEVRFHYLQTRMEGAKQQYKQEVDRINAQLVLLDIEEIKENAWHTLRDNLVAALEENAERRAIRQRNEDVRHAQRLNEINNDRQRLRDELQKSRDKLADEFKKN